MKNKLKSIVRNVASFSEEVERVEMHIRARAFEHYIARGGTHGHDVEDWFAATNELLRQPEVNVSESETEVLVNFILSEHEMEHIQLLISDSAILISGTNLNEADVQVFRVVQLSQF